MQPDEKPSARQAPAFEPPTVDPALLSKVIADLELSTSTDLAGVRKTLVAHVNAFALSRYFEAVTPTLHQDAKRARKMALLIEQLRDEATKFSAQPLSFLQHRFDELQGGVQSWSKVFSDLATMQEMLGQFGGANFSKRRKDEHLRNAVGGLMLYLERLIGRRAKVRRGHAEYGIAPQFTSPESRTIAALLRVVEPTLPDTTIVNQVLAIRRGNHGRLLTEFEHKLLLRGKVTPY